jgi:hypothetical protein
MGSIANRNRALGLGLVLGAILITSVTVEAAKIQFDLGRGTTAITQSVGSPGLAAGAFTAADTTWNETTSTTTSYNSLKYADGTAATGVQAQYGSTGAGTSPTGLITWNDTTDLLNTNGTGDGGVALYTGNNMVQNLSFFASFFNSSGGALGLRVSGLDAGQYAVYVTAVHPQALSRTYNIGIGVNLMQQVPTPESLTANLTSTWTDGKNFALGTVNISSTSDWLGVISSNLNAFPEINGIQIVALPEPASLGLLSSFSVLVLRRRARKA